MAETSAEQIVAKIRQAGVIGAGGGGFPAYVKLQAKVATVIANGSECEPLLASDRTMMTQKALLLIDGMQIAMRATGAKEGIIALKEHYHDAVQALQKILPADGSIRLHLLENYYPAGDEFILVYEVTGKVIPEGGIPLNVGIVVSNVISLMQMAEGFNGKPVIERTVTLAGEFSEPQVLTVPIGTTYQQLIALGGGLKQKDAMVIDGGPMMGKPVTNLEEGIAKTTSGVLALPQDNFIVRNHQKTLEQMIKQSKSACCQCFRCSDLCPRNLIGHDIYPHMTMRTIDYNLARPTENITAAFLCSQCGVCELAACDFMLLSPRKIYAEYRKQLVSKGVKNPHQRKNIKAREEFALRKLSIATLMKKVGIEEYNIELPFTGKKEVNLVRIPYGKHVGAKAEVLVNLGQKVRMCDVIAATPKNKLGTVYHASIAGKITDITDQYIEITGS